MQVAFFTDSYHPYVSGVVNSIETLRHHLEQSDNEVSIFAPAYPGRQGWDRHDGRVFRYASLRAPVYHDYQVAIPLSIGLTATLRRRQVQIVHAHSPFIMGQLGAVAARRLGLPICFTFHTLYDVYFDLYAGKARELFRPALHNYLRSFCGQCDLIIAPSPFVRDNLSRFGIETPVVVLPTGIELHKFTGPPTFDVRRKWGIPADAALFLSVGRVAAEKDPELLLKAFALVARDAAQAYLLFVGDGPLRPDLTEKAAALGLSERVRFAGRQLPARMPDFYKAADFFAFPSRSETQGLVLVEAMAAGLPVIAVDSPAAADVVGYQTGAGLFAAATPDALAAAMWIVLRAAEPPDLAAMTQAARSRAELFSAANMARQLAAVYRQLLPISPQDEGRQVS